MPYKPDLGTLPFDFILVAKRPDHGMGKHSPFRLLAGTMIEMHEVIAPDTLHFLVELVGCRSVSKMTSFFVILALLLVRTVWVECICGGKGFSFVEEIRHQNLDLPMLHHSDVTIWAPGA